MIDPQRWNPAGGLALEPNALRAAKTTTGSLALTAGPGAGKTEMLAQRADFLLQTGTCYYPQRILAISFKVDASRNLKDRVRKRCGAALASRFDSYTFHAFAKRIIDRFRPVLTGQNALDPDYTIGDKRSQHSQINFDDLVPLALEILSKSDIAINAIRQTYSKDKYASFKALEAAQRRGEDYAIDSRRVDGSLVTIIAPHGGNIEPLTDSIADRIAGRYFSFYAFRGLKRGSRLHITSSRFDEPLCEDLLAGHGRALSIHGWGETGERVCIGGRDRHLMAALKASLVAVDITVEDAVGKLRGADPKNIVNRCRSTRGVQLELTMALRKNRAKIAAFVRAVRITLKHLKQMH